MTVLHFSFGDCLQCWLCICESSPSNPEGLTSLWVGNVQPVVTQGVLEEMFSQ